MASSVRLRNLRSPPPPPKRTKDGPPFPQLTPFAVRGRYATRCHFGGPCPTSCAPFRGHLLVGFSDRPPIAVAVSRRPSPSPPRYMPQAVRRIEVLRLGAESLRGGWVDNGVDGGPPDS